jgi:hypothetical protein
VPADPDAAAAAAALLAYHSPFRRRTITVKVCGGMHHFLSMCQLCMLGWLPYVAIAA